MTATNMCSNFVGNGPVPPEFIEDGDKHHIKSLNSTFKSSLVEYYLVHLCYC